MSIWYVDPAGNDTASGGPLTPLRSIAAAVTKAVAGDVIEVAGGDGVFNEAVTWDRNLTFRRAPGRPRPVLEGGGRLANGMLTYAAGGSSVDGFEIRNYTRRGVQMYGPRQGAVTNHVVSGCHIHHLANDDPAMTEPTTAIYLAYGNPKVQSNHIHHIRGKNESIAAWFVQCNNHAFDGNTVYAVRKEAMRDAFGLSGRFTSNSLAMATTGLAFNESAAALVANNQIAHCMMGINPKHTNDPFVPADSTQYQSAVLYMWGLTEDTVPNWARFWHNTIHDCSWGHIVLGPNVNPDGVSGFTNQVDVRNNLFTGPGTAYLWDAPQARTDKTIVDYNVHDTNGSPRHRYMRLYDLNDATAYKDSLAQIRTDLGWEMHGQEIPVTFEDADGLDLEPRSAVPPGAALPTQWGTQVGSRGVSLPDGLELEYQRPMIALSSRTTTQSNKAYGNDGTLMTDYIGAFPSDEWIVYDAGAEVTLNTLCGENIHHFLSYNPQDVALEIGPSPTGPWTQVMAGKIVDSGGTAWPFDWPDATSRYWRFRMLTNWGHGSSTVLSEVRFGRYRTSAPVVPPTGLPRTAVEIERVLVDERTTVQMG